MSTASSPSDLRATDCPPWCTCSHGLGLYESASFDETVQYGYHEATFADKRICISCQDSLTMTPEGFEFARSEATVSVESDLDLDMTAGDVRELAQSLLAAADILDELNTGEAK